MIRIGAQVNLQGIKSELVFGIFAFLFALQERYGFEQTLRITSANDRSHSYTSLHYDGGAVDIDSKPYPRDSVRDFTAKLNAELGPDFDLILEDFSFPNEHWHLEWQPKRRTGP